MSTSVAISVAPSRAQARAHTAAENFQSVAAAPALIRMRDVDAAQLLPAPLTPVEQVQGRLGRFRDAGAGRIAFCSPPRSRQRTSLRHAKTSFMQHCWQRLCEQSMSRADCYRPKHPCSFLNVYQHSVVRETDAGVDGIGDARRRQGAHLASPDAADKTPFGFIARVGQ